MNYGFWKRIVRLRQLYARSLEAPSQAWGLSRAALDVLLFLANNPEMTRAVDVVENRGINKSHVSIAVKELCRRGFLEACPDPVDGRAVQLKITEDAQGVITDGRKSQQTHFARLFEGFTKEEFAQWRRFQERLSANMNRLEQEKKS